MHIVLTDVLACPRCGPQFGLILLADRVDDRRVLEGVLGCPNCREKYAVRAGLGLLRVEFDDIEPVAIPAPAGDGGQEAVRIAALAGITEGPALLLLMGPLARYAPMLAGLLENVEVVVAGAGLEAWAEDAGVSRLDVGGRLPIHSRSLRAVVLGGGAADALLEEGMRVVGPLGRLVLEPPPADADERLARGGFRPLARDERTLVAARG
jgi:uncharacterized protein YbaR (Trm112 family)